MVKAKLFDVKGKEKGNVELPKLVSGIIRKDILAKVFEAQKREQPYGAMDFAGRNYSAAGILKRRRHAWKGTYGKGISRAPRKIMSRHGQSFQWVGASANYSRGGGVAHPHRPEENQFKKVNKKELVIALSSALAGTFDLKATEKKYSIKVSHSAVIAEDKLLNVKTKEFLAFLKSVFGEAFEKLLKHKKVRAGSGKSRGRRYKSNAGLVFIIASDEKMNRAGVDVVKVKELKISDLAPNGEPGRFAIYTEKALKEIDGVWKQ
jgi:large subunit ribosomal protein L4e